MAPCKITTHSPGPAALAVLAVDDPEPDWIDTEGPFGPMLVEPLSPPGPVWIVVEFDEDEPCDGDDLPFAPSFSRPWLTPRP